MSGPNAHRPYVPAGDPLDLIETALEARDCHPTRHGHDRLRAICPACGEHNRSKLSVVRGDRQPLAIHCFAGCDWRTVLDALALSYGVAFQGEDLATWNRFMVADAAALTAAQAALDRAAAWLRELRSGSAVGTGPAAEWNQAGAALARAARQLGVER